jgi:predicted TIM-barrel fold metal-dependent hydrolase
MPLGTKPSSIHDEPSRERDIERRALDLLRSLDEADAVTAPSLERSSAIDFHAHVVDPSRNVLSLARLAHKGLGKLARALPLETPARAHGALGRLAERAATLGPRAMFSLYPLYRRLPRSGRAVIEAAAAPSLLLHAVSHGWSDLLIDDMTASAVSHAVVIAMDPLASSDYVLDLCAASRGRFFAVVTVPPREPDVRSAVKRAKARGAVGVKLHACHSGCAPDGPYATELVDAAADEGLFVIVHTGHARLVGFYRQPGYGDPRDFVPHFERRKDATFILAHMNMAEPEVALDVARHRENVFVDTSWQEARDVRRAVAILGGERVLFASDWPFGGDQLARSKRAVEKSGLPPSVLDLILHLNARKILLARVNAAR